MENEILDEEIYEISSTPKTYTRIAAVIAVVVLLAIMIFYYQSSVVSAAEDVPISLKEVFSMSIFLIGAPIGLLMSLIAKKRKESAPQLWWFGFVINLICALLEIPALYFVAQGFNNPTAMIL